MTLKNLRIISTKSNIFNSISCTGTDNLQVEWFKLQREFTVVDPASQSTSADDTARNPSSILKPLNPLVQTRCLLSSETARIQIDV